MIFGRFFLLLFYFMATAELRAQDSVQGENVLDLIPKPVSVLKQEGVFRLSDETVIVIDNDESKADAEVFNSLLVQLTGLELKIMRTDIPMASSILLTKTSSPAMAKDSYKLTVNLNQVSVFGKTAGVFYGLQTLLQLIQHTKENGYSIPCLEMSDEPRYPWRGMHLDVSRHFFPTKFIKKYIDLIAFYKMNMFHWHLTDDQGWRIEIKKYPKLTSVGAWRNGSMIGPFSAQQVDSIRYGGFYSQEEIREIVAYAGKRHVTIVPEIEMPGHSLAALASYPTLSCTGGPFEVAQAWGVFDDVFCPKEETFNFLKNVLTEVSELFPGKYIHIGGDECQKIRWKNCSHCKALMKKLKLKNETQLQSYFIRRIGKMLKLMGKQVIGWDEILEGGLAPGAAVMSWRGTEGGIAAARQHHQVVMTPGAYCYFDHYQGSQQNEPLAIGGYTTIEKVYSFEPMPSALNEMEQHYILGAQGNVWTEYITSPEQVEYMALPRMCALAEVLWTPKNQKDYPDFQNRLLRHFSILDKLNVNYSKSIYELKTSVKSLEDHHGVSMELSSPFNSGKIVYTMDGTDPEINSTLYSVPVTINKNGKIKAAYFENGKQKGNTLSREFFINESTGKKIVLETPPHENYFCNGAQSLVDGIKGDLHKHGQNWLGWWGPDMVATIDLGEKKSISEISMDVYNDEPAWIYLPKSIEVLTSDDGLNWASSRKISKDEIKIAREVITIKLENQSARFIKVIAKNAGKIPDGKPGSGNNSWLFVDEISIK